MLHVAHFELSRAGDSFVTYRLEGSGHVILLPRHWFPAKPPQDISIEIRDRQLSLLEEVKHEANR